MRDPCDKCIERDFCRDTGLARPCARKQSYDKWKAKAAEIRQKEGKK